MQVESVLWRMARSTDDGLQVLVTTDVSDQSHGCSLHITRALLQHLFNVLEAIFAPDNSEGDGLTQLHQRQSVTDRHGGVVDYRNVPDPPYRSLPSRDVLQSSQGGLLCANAHAASQQGQVHAHSDGAPQPLDALRVRLVLQQGAAILQVLKEKGLVFEF